MWSFKNTQWLGNPNFRIPSLNSFLKTLEVGKKKAAWPSEFWCEIILEIVVMWKGRVNGDFKLMNTVTQGSEVSHA